MRLYKTKEFRFAYAMKLVRFLNTSAWKSLTEAVMLCQADAWRRVLICTGLIIAHS